MSALSTRPGPDDEWLLWVEQTYQIPGDVRLAILVELKPLMQIDAHAKGGQRQLDGPLGPLDAVDRQRVADHIALDGRVPIHIPHLDREGPGQPGKEMLGACVDVPKRVDRLFDAHQALGHDNLKGAFHAAGIGRQEGLHLTTGHRRTRWDRRLGGGAVARQIEKARRKRCQIGRSAQVGLRLGWSALGHRCKLGAEPVDFGHRIGQCGLDTIAAPLGHGLLGGAFHGDCGVDLIHKRLDLIGRQGALIALTIGGGCQALGGLGHLCGDLLAHGRADALLQEVQDDRDHIDGDHLLGDVEMLDGLRAEYDGKELVEVLEV